MRAYTHTQMLIYTGTHTSICTRTCMHTHTLSYTPTNSSNPRNLANIHKHARKRSRVRTRTHTHTLTQAHTCASCVWICNGRHCCTHGSPPRLTRTPSFSSADDPMTRCGALGLRGEVATPMRQGVWRLLPVVLNAVPIHTQCCDHYLRDEASTSYMIFK